MRHEILTTDVLVVGAGPAGLATALAAARHGADVLVVERRPSTSTIPRATGVSTRTMEIFRSWGLAARIREGAVPCDPRFAVVDTAVDDPRELVSSGYPSAREALAVSPAAPAICPQDHIEPVLVDAVRAAGGRVWFGTPAEELTVDAAGVSATVGARRVRARFVVGADGPRSGVRAALGIELEHLGMLGEFEQVLFRADLAPRLPQGAHALTFTNRPGAAGVLLPVGVGRWTFGREHDPDRPTPSQREWVRVLRAATGIDDLELQLLGSQRFTMAAEVAASFRSGPGFLVGDAAHRLTPVGGLGMNTAIHDGHELGWRLAWAVRGLAGEALLAGYAAEREPVGRANAARSLVPDEPQSLDGLPGDLGRTYRSAVIASDGRPPAVGHLRTARPGERAPHAWVRLRGRRVSTLDALADRLTLLTGPGGRWRAAAATVATVPLTVLTDGRELTGPTLTTRYRLGPDSAVLVRPDGIVAWRGDDIPADAAAALHRALATALGREAARAAA